MMNPVVRWLDTSVLIAFCWHYDGIPPESQWLSRESFSAQFAITPRTNFPARPLSAHLF
jgi:hypothetical protein